MYRLQADDMIKQINTYSIAMSDGQSRENTIKELVKSSRGLHGIVEEIRNIKNVKY